MELGSDTITRMIDHLSYDPSVQKGISAYRWPVELGSEWALDRTIRMTDNLSHMTPVYMVQSLCQKPVEQRAGIRHNH